MNIFEIYLDKIKKLIIKLNNENIIQIPDSLNGINVEIPPAKFDCDISTNVAMVLSKTNKRSSIDLANQLSNLIKYDDDKIAEILKSGKTTTIKVTQNVNVHHLYWTAWNENGSTRFAEDIYKRDAAIYNLLSKN